MDLYVFQMKLSGKHFLIILILFTFHIHTCLNKEQKINLSNDFLLHESGGTIFDSKKEYGAQFPTLKTPSTQFTQVTKGPVNTMSTVAQPKPQSNGKRDYVAPQRPTVAHATTTTPKPSSNGQTSSSPASSSPQMPPKRDYVAPQFPTLRPVGTTPLTPTLAITQPASGNVKDLINFYDNKKQNGPVTPKKPSYSSILQSSTSSLPVSPTSPAPGSPKLPSKPTSFSAVVSNKGDNTPKHTPKPTSTSSSSNIPKVTNGGQGSPLNSNNKDLTDIELQTVSEELLKKDTNNAAKYITINYQEKTTASSKEDKAPLQLLTIAPEAWSILTVQKFLPLLDNYERDTLINEHVTPQERTEENVFMDTVMATPVMRHLMTFLKDKGYVTPDPKQQRDLVKQIWFGLYSRGKGKISSSGFEHIFLSELKNGDVSGLHNWIYFSKEETANRINYLGYLKYAQMNDKGAVIKMHFNQQGVDKPVGTMFIGTSPEFEMAIYTLCYLTRVDQDCNIKLGAKDVNIVSHNFRYRSKNYIGSAYPQI